MQNIKKKMSLALLQTIEPIIKDNIDLIELQEKEGQILIIKDVDKNSDFIFTIEKEEIKENKLLIIFYCKPWSDTIKKDVGTTYELGDFEIKLKQWFLYLKQYNSKTIFDDPLSKQYQKEFYDDFKIIDDDSEVKGFSFYQQLILDNYVSGVLEYVEELDTEDIGATLKADLITEITELRTSISNETKDGFIKRFSKFLAKTRKNSFKVCEFAFKEFIKEVIKEGAKKGFNFSVDHAPQYLEYFKSLL